MAEEYVLALLPLPQTGDELMDWLLAFHGELTFTSQEIDYHGLAPDDLAGPEQVTGRQRRLLVRVRVSREQLQPLLDGLEAAFPEAGWPYWVIPLHGSGRIGGGEAANRLRRDR